MLQHCIKIPLIQKYADTAFYLDMLRTNFPDYTHDATHMTCGAQSDIFIARFANDIDLFTWINWLIANGANFSYEYSG